MEAGLASRIDFNFLEQGEKSKITFLCSLALLGLSGVWLELAGAPAIGEAVGFSIVSAGILVISFFHPEPGGERELGAKGGEEKADHLARDSTVVYPTGACFLRIKRARAGPASTRGGREGGLRLQKKKKSDRAPASDRASPGRLRPPQLPLLWLRRAAPPGVYIADGSSQFV